jgi:hypothetical protein
MRSTDLCHTHPVKDRVIPEGSKLTGHAGRNPERPFRLVAGCPASQAVSRARLHRYRSTDVPPSGGLDACVLKVSDSRHRAIEMRSTNLCHTHPVKDRVIPEGSKLASSPGRNPKPLVRRAAGYPANPAASRAHAVDTEAPTCRPAATKTCTDWKHPPGGPCRNTASPDESPPGVVVTRLCPYQPGKLTPARNRPRLRPSTGEGRC